MAEPFDEECDAGFLAIEGEHLFGFKVAMAIMGCTSSVVSILRGAAGLIRLFRASVTIVVTRSVRVGVVWIAWRVVSGVLVERAPVGDRHIFQLSSLAVGIGCSVSGSIFRRF